LRPAPGPRHVNLADVTLDLYMDRSIHDREMSPRIAARPPELTPNLGVAIRQLRDSRVTDAARSLLHEVI
jgi:hypothetical protein